MERKKRMIILGAGISGLTAAYEVAKKRPKWDCLILEKGKSPGGHMKTGNECGLIVEKGPHIFKVSRNHDFLRLIEEVGFSQELIFSSKKAKKRYLCVNKKVKSIIKVAGKDLLKALLLEWQKPQVNKEETIWEFSSRRFGKKIAEKVFDPLTLGIYAGDSKKLSMDACFPTCKSWEKEKGSITKALFSSLMRRKKLSSKGLFSFKKGVGSFITHLEKQIQFPILYEKEALSLEKKGDGFLVHTQDETFEADEVILALPAYVAASLLEEASQRLLKIPYQSITSVNALIEGDVLKHLGFGYLVPTVEGDSILGVLFDSCIFPEQDEVKHTKLTLMIRGVDLTQEEIYEAVDRSLKEHLAITKSPKEVVWKKMPLAIPQPVIGHDDNIKAIRKMLPPGISLAGNYLEGVSVNDAVRVASSLFPETAVSIAPKG